MKKFALPIGVLAILIAGVLLLMNQKEEVVPTADNEIVVSETQTEDDNISEVSSEKEQTNVKSAKVDSDEVNEIKELDHEKVIVNPITGETHPASYYDEVLADGYTYNNSAPIPEDWIIEPATDEYPATLDYEKIKETLPESYIHNGRITKHFTMVPDYMIGYNPRILLLNTEQEFATKKDFLNWLSNYIDSDIYFVSESEFDNKNGGTNWNIFIKSSNIEDVYNSYDNLTKEEKLYMRVSSFYLPKYKGTKELEEAVQATMNAMKE